MIMIPLKYLKRSVIRSLVLQPGGSVDVRNLVESGWYIIELIRPVAVPLTAPPVVSSIEVALDDVGVARVTDLMPVARFYVAGQTCRVINELPADSVAFNLFFEGEL